MFFTNYFFKKNTDNNKSVKNQTKKSIKKLYLVINKNTQTPLGIYDTLEQAKLLGEKSTYHNCTILEFILNDKCVYFHCPVFENK
jgi:hypothetical protein